METKVRRFGNELITAMGAFANVKGLQFYRDNNEDPYITLKEVRQHILGVYVKLIGRTMKTTREKSLN